MTTPELCASITSPPPGSTSAPSSTPGATILTASWASTPRPPTTTPRPMIPPSRAGCIPTPTPTPQSLFTPATGTRATSGPTTRWKRPWAPPRPAPPLRPPTVPLSTARRTTPPPPACPGSPTPPPERLPTRAGCTVWPATSSCGWSSAAGW